MLLGSNSYTHSVALISEFSDQLYFEQQSELIEALVYRVLVSDIILVDNFKRGSSNFC